MNPVKILCDSTCDLSPELIEKYQFGILPLTVSLGDQTYSDGVDITPQDIYHYFDTTKKLAKTAAASPLQFTDFYRQWTEQGYDVVCFTISSGFSSNFSNACIAAEEFDNVYPVDSQNLSSGIGLLMLKAAEMASEGLSAAEIAEKINGMREKVHTSFIIDTLEYLWKGGRCSGVAALGANVLKLKPSIFVADGKMTVGKKYRGSLESALLSYVKSQLEGRTDLDLSRIFVTYSGDDYHVASKVIAEVKKYADFAEILETTAGATVSTHCGPNTLGILFMTK